MKNYFLLFLLLCAMPLLPSWKNLASKDGLLFAAIGLVGVDYLSYVYEEFQRVDQMELSKKNKKRKKIWYCVKGATCSLLMAKLLVDIESVFHDKNPL